MMKVVRLIGSLLACAITLFMLSTMVSIFLAPGDVVSVAVAVPPAALVGWWMWRATAGSKPGPVGSMLVGALLTGAAAFTITFFEILLIAPDANQGPLLAIFITGPLGFIAGGVGGFIIWQKRGTSD